MVCTTAWPGSTTESRSPLSEPGGEDRLERVNQLVGASLRIATDPMLHSGARVREVAAVAGHDRELLGRAWVKVRVGATRHPGRVLSTAESILRAALQEERGRAA